jgi:hypothetical protein
MISEENGNEQTVTNDIVSSPQTESHYIGNEADCIAKPIEIQKATSLLDIVVRRGTYSSIESQLC